MIKDFTQDGLADSGFQGFVPLASLDTSMVSSAAGVYAVFRQCEGPPNFLARSCGGHFKGKDPSVDVELLDSRWIDDCDLIYIGKANGLRSRLRQYRDFGRGKPVGHWGGRYVWQIADSDRHLVCWKTTVDSPRSVESELLAAFRGEYGSLPFGNIVS